jgi:hypothetical protein
MINNTFEDTNVMFSKTQILSDAYRATKINRDIANSNGS